LNIVDFLNVDFGHDTLIMLLIVKAIIIYKKIQICFSECRCKKLGTEVCNHNTGDCACLPGVEGEICDRCEPDHWGFESGQPVIY
jgi:hypothetical protein